MKDINYLRLKTYFYPRISVGGNFAFGWDLVMLLPAMAMMKNTLSGFQ